MLVVKANHAATGTDTINIDSLGAKTINRTAAIATNTIFAFVYDSVSDEFNVVAPLGGITTRGDMIRGDSNGDAERLPLGSVRQILRSDGTDIAYDDQITLGTEQASTSGTEIDITIPLGVKRVSIGLDVVSTNGSSDIIVQLGDSGGVETSGYDGNVVRIASAGVHTAHSSGFNLNDDVSAAQSYTHYIEMMKINSSHKWIMKSQGGRGGNDYIFNGYCVKTLSGELTTVRITTIGGSNTFDGGTINYQCE